MRGFLMRISGGLLILAAVLGLAISIAGLLAVGRFERDVSAAIRSGFDLTDQALSTTGEGLAAALVSLEQAETTLASVQTTLESLGTTVQASQPTLNAVSDLLGQSLPESLDSTQQALDSAQATARTIDDFLLALSRFPFLGSLVYQPETPLNQALGDVNASLDDIPAALKEAQSGLDGAADSLDDLQAGLLAVAQEMDAIQTAVQDGRAVVTQYQGLVQEVQERLPNAERTTQNWLRLARIGVSLLLVWLGLAQIGLMLQGVQLLSNRQRPVSP